MVRNDIVPPRPFWQKTVFQTNRVTNSVTSRLDLTMNKLFFCGLYFVQGAILAYVSNFQKPYLSQSGVAVSQIAILTSTMILPFIGKIFFGYVSDRFSLFGFGHRKPYMLLGLGLGAACFVVLMSIDPKIQFSYFFTLMVTATFGMALFDTCADGFAIDTNRVGPHDESSSIQSYMMSGKALGYIVLSGLFGWIVGKTGYSVVFGALAGIIAVIFVWVLVFAKEPKTHKKSKDSVTDFFRAMGWPAALFALYAIGYSILSFGLDGLITLFLHSELKLESTDIGIYGSVRGLGAIAGAILAGLIGTKIGRKTAAFSSLVFLMLASLSLMLLKDATTSIVIGFVWGAAWAFQETVFVILAMRMAEQAFAATAFALLMIFSNVGTAIGEGLATSLSESIGFKQVFLSFGLANLIVIPLLIVVFRFTPKLSEKSA